MTMTTSPLLHEFIDTLPVCCGDKQLVLLINFDDELESMLLLFLSVMVDASTRLHDVSDTTATDIFISLISDDIKADDTIESVNMDLFLERSLTVKY